MDRCEWVDEDDEGRPIGEQCGAVAQYVSCRPFVGSRTCEAHKCRCATPLREPKYPPDTEYE